MAPLGLGHKILCPPLSSQFSDLLDLRDPETAGGIKEATAEKKRETGRWRWAHSIYIQSRKLLLPVVNFAKQQLEVVCGPFGQNNMDGTLPHTIQEGNQCTTTKEKLRDYCTDTYTVAGRRHDWTH